VGINSILKNVKEIEHASLELRKSGVPIAEGAAKSWDMGRAFDFIRGHSKKDACILDVGAYKSRLLEWLYTDGYRGLYGCDISGIEWRWVASLYLREMRFLDLLGWLCGKGPIRLSRQDLLKTKYPSSHFNVITSISVIEHGVDTRLYVKEMSRLLKPGGYLITSCDYWPTYIETLGTLPYGLNWNIQTQKDVEGLIRLAADSNLFLIEPMDFSYEEPVVKWNGKEYTFAFFIFKKDGP